MKLIILGANGMLGSMLSFVCRQRNYPALRVTRSMFDVLKDPISKLEKYFDVPCCVVNCIGAIPQKTYTDADYTLLNTTYPQELSKLCEARRIPFIHMSTNCVFSGSVQECDESCIPDATDIYGLSKYKGEPTYGMTIRCSIIGPERVSQNGLMEWFLSQPKDVFGYTDHYWNGLTTLELSTILVQCVIDGSIAEKGVFHFFSDTVVSKYDILCELKRLFGKSITIHPKANGVKHFTLKSLYTHPRQSIVGQLAELQTLYEQFNAPCKVLFFNPCHIKNVKGLELMCASHGLRFEQTNDPNCVFQGDYDILISNTTYIDPEILPTHAKVIFGPQHFVFPHGDVLGTYRANYEHRVVFNSLSKWVEVMFLEFGSFKVPIVQFPFAVDVDKFKMNRIPEFDCLVYVKSRHLTIVNAVIETLMRKGLTFRIIAYGSYTETDYINLLSKCRFMLVIDRHESQGFAIQEAMSCNVPLLVLDVNSMHEEADDRDYVTFIYKETNKNLFATVVPYWSDSCGILLKSLDELDYGIDKIMPLCDSHYTPRDFILRELSPHKCMSRILSYFDIPTSPDIF